MHHRPLARSLALCSIIRLPSTVCNARVLLRVYIRSLVFFAHFLFCNISRELLVRSLDFWIFALAIGGDRRRSKAIGGDRRRSEAIGGDRRRSEAIEGNWRRFLPNETTIRHQRSSIIVNRFMAPLHSINEWRRSAPSSSFKALCSLFYASSHIPKRGSVRPSVRS